MILGNPWATRQTVSWPRENLEFPDWTPLTIDIGLVRTNAQGTISLSTLTSWLLKENYVLVHFIK